LYRLKKPRREIHAAIASGADDKKVAAVIKVSDWQSKPRLPA
jgi:hypothetical protein